MRGALNPKRCPRLTMTTAAIRIAAAIAISTVFREGVDLMRFEVGVSPEPLPISFSAKPRSRADWNRSSGAFSRQRLDTLIMPGGMFFPYSDRSFG